MKKIFLTILLILFYTISSFGQTVTKEEYEIYSIVLNKIYKDEKTVSILILNKTKIAKDSYIVNKTTDRDFKKKNKISVQLKPMFRAKHQYQLVNKDEVDQLLEIGEKEADKAAEERKAKKLPPYAEPDYGTIWKYFFDKYPNVYGYYEFSRIGFSPNKNFAKVNVEVTSAEWDSYATYLLKKVKGRWKIYNSFKVENIV